MLSHRALVGRPHVDRHRLKLLPPAFRQGFPDLIGRLFRPAGGHVQHPRAVEIGQGGDIVLPLSEALLVETDVLEAGQAPPRQPPLHPPAA